jgi:hypothetical protein
MPNIESMEALLVELKRETKDRRDKTFDKLNELSKILKEGEEENSEENTASATAGAELGGH